MEATTFAHEKMYKEYLEKLEDTAYCLDSKIYYFFYVNGKFSEEKLEKLVDEATGDDEYYNALLYVLLRLYTTPCFPYPKSPSGRHYYNGKPVCWPGDEKEHTLSDMLGEVASGDAITAMTQIYEDAGGDQETLEFLYSLTDWTVGEEVSDFDNEWSTELLVTNIQMNPPDEDDWEDDDDLMEDLTEDGPEPDTETIDGKEYVFYDESEEPEVNAKAARQREYIRNEVPNLDVLVSKIETLADYMREYGRYGCDESDDLRNMMKDYMLDQGRTIFEYQSDTITLCSKLAAAQIRIQSARRRRERK